MDISRFGSVRCLLGAAGFVLVCGVPTPSGAVMPEIEAPSLVAPGLGCGAVPAANALYSQVALRRQRPRQSPVRRAEAARSSTPRAAPREAPREASEPLPSLSNAFYTCAATPWTAQPVGAGWLAVGPVRRS